LLYVRPVLHSAFLYVRPVLHSAFPLIIF
jgi:hypothetical protein